MTHEAKNRRGSRSRTSSRRLAGIMGCFMALASMAGCFSHNRELGPGEVVILNGYVMFPDSTPAVDFIVRTDPETSFTRTDSTGFYELTRNLGLREYEVIAQDESNTQQGSTIVEVQLGDYRAVNIEIGAEEVRMPRLEIDPDDPLTTRTRGKKRTGGGGG